MPNCTYRAVRQVATAVVAAAAALPVPGGAQPAGYPARPVRVIVPFSAGSPVEIPARPVALRLAEMLGQQFIIDNRPGASGTIGTELVARAPRDGHTLLYTNCSHSSNPSHYKKLPYDSLADFATVTQTNTTYGNVLVVHPSVPARSVKEFIALAKKAAGQAELCLGRRRQPAARYRRAIRFDGRHPDGARRRTRAPPSHSPTC